MAHQALPSRSIAASATLAMALVALQLAVVRLAADDLAVRIVLPLTIALAPLALWPHRHSLGTWVIAVGLCANLAAILANGGLMPIERSTVVAAVGEERAAAYQAGAWIEGSKDVLAPEGGGRLTALGDAIIVRVGSRGIAASPGDVVILAGVLTLLVEAAAGAMRSRQHPDADTVAERDLPLAA